MHHTDYSAGMKQITIRMVKDDCVTEARRRAKERYVSMNQIFLETIAAGLGMAKDKRTNDLEKYSGGADFGEGWDDYVKHDLNKIDEELWK